MVSQGYDPFNYHQPADRRARARRARREQQGTRQPAGTPDDAAKKLRAEIAEAHGRAGFATAADKYLQLLTLSDDATLPKQQQLDVSNHLMTEQRYAQAADAYERLLRAYPTYEHIADIRLMLGIIYGRYLKQNDKARDNLRLAVEGLHDDNKLAMARSELQALGGP